MAPRFLGPGWGKFGRDKSGKITQVNAFPGHNLPLGALGVFILWLGWYGFNGAAATSLEQLGSIFVTTTIAPAVATVTCMIFTWVKYGKPDVSMCLNASLAGLVAITAPCDVTDALGSIVIGAVAGVLVVFGVWALDYKLRIDDPVGAVAVHCLNGIWGTVAVGLFATTAAPGNDTYVGLFYGGGVSLLALQMLGMLSVILWTAVTITITFLVIKKTVGLRASQEEEITGLDATEHGLPSAYADFAPTTSLTSLPEENAYPEPAASKAHVDESAPAQAVTRIRTAPESRMKLSNVTILCNQAKFEDLKTAMNRIGVTGMTVTQVLGCGIQKGKTEYYRGVPMAINLLPKVQVEIVVSKVPVAEVIDAAKKSLYTGHIGDGKIFVYDVENVVKVRTGEEGYDALQGEE